MRSSGPTILKLPIQATWYFRCIVDIAVTGLEKSSINDASLVTKVTKGRGGMPPNDGRFKHEALTVRQRNASTIPMLSHGNDGQGGLRALRGVAENRLRRGSREFPPGGEYWLSRRLLMAH
jgi:hypothetical protein